jgi:hypothetical protein
MCDLHDQDRQYVFDLFPREQRDRRDDAMVPVTETDAVVASSRIRKEKCYEN